MPSAANMPLPAAHALRKLGHDLAPARRKRRISTAPSHQEQAKAKSKRSCKDALD